VIHPCLRRQVSHRDRLSGLYEKEADLDWFLVDSDISDVYTHDRIINYV